MNDKDLAKRLVKLAEELTAEGSPKELAETAITNDLDELAEFVVYLRRHWTSNADVETLSHQLGTLQSSFIPRMLKELKKLEA